MCVREGGQGNTPSRRAAKTTAPIPTIARMNPFIDRLAAQWRAANSLLCVGLDPDPTRFPAHLREREDAIYRFCREIVAATADLVCAFKPQIAYFASASAEEQLQELIRYIKSEF